MVKRKDCECGDKSQDHRQAKPRACVKCSCPSFKMREKPIKRQISKIPLEEGSEVKGNMGDRMVVKDHRFVLAEREEVGS